MSFSGIRYLIKEGFKNVWTNRMMSIASIGVLIACLILTGAAALLSLNVREIVESVGDTNVTTVFLDYSVNDVEAVYIGKNILNIENVDTAVFFPKEEAILEYKDTLGEEVFENMQGENNPLPHAFKVTMKDISLYDDTITQISRLDGIDSVGSHTDVANRLTKLDNLISTLSFWIVLALTVISLFIISNTIRMSMYSRRFEISIMKSVGATDAFVRVPFIFEGMLIGLISALLSVGGLFLVYDLVMNAITHIMASFTVIPFMDVFWIVLGGFVAAGLLIGAASGFISIRKYLKKEGNEILGW